MCVCVQAVTGELDPLYVVEVLLHCSKESVKNAATEAARPSSPGEKGEMQVRNAKPFYHFCSFYSPARGTYYFSGYRLSSFLLAGHSWCKTTPFYCVIPLSYTIVINYIK